MASRNVEEENWDDDFEFTPSPRHSPIPAIAPIHTFSHATRSNTLGGGASRGTPPAFPPHQQHINPYRSNSDVHSQRSGSAIPRHTSTSSRPNLHQAAQHQPSNYQQQQQQQHQHDARKARWSENSEEDWDMDEPTISQPIPSQPAKPPTSLQQSTDLTQPRTSSLDPRDTTTTTTTTGGKGGNISPTMSAFSIPLSIDSSLRHHPHSGYAHHRRDTSQTGHSISGAQSITGHSIAGHSIGGSSTNFLLHTGRRSVLEMEKGRQQQDRERRRLRKKSRPGPGAAAVMSVPVPVGDDDDEFDVYGREGGGRYAIPVGRSGMEGGDQGEEEGDSSERGSSGEDELSELEEEHPAQVVTPSIQSTASRSAATTHTHQQPSTSTSSPLIKAPSRLLNLALNPTKSHDRLTNNSSNLPPPPLTSGASRPPVGVGVGSRSTTVMNVPAVLIGERGMTGAGTATQPYPSSQSHGQSYTSGHGGHSTPHGPSKLVRKVSGTNVLTKSSPHMRGNAILAKHPSSAISPPSATRPHDLGLHTQPSKHHDAPMTRATANLRDDDGTTAAHSHATQHQPPPHPHTQAQAQHHTTHAYPASPPHRSKALDDCGASLAPSTSSHKEKRQSMLSRLGSLKRWGHTSGSPSTSGLSNPDSSANPNPNATASTPSEAGVRGRGGLGMLGSTLGLSRPSGRDNISPRVFGTRLPSFLGGSKVDLHASNDRPGPGSGAVGEHKVGSDASLARSPGRKYGLLRKPSLVLSNASSSALARVTSGDEREDEPVTGTGTGVAGTGTGRKDGKDEHAKRGINPFRRVSIQGVKRLVSDHHHHHRDHQEQERQQQRESPSTTPAGTPEKKKGDKDKEPAASAGQHHHHRTISFSALARGKLGAAVEKSSRQKDAPAPAAGRKSSDGRESSPFASATANSSVPHTLGRTVALAKAPKPPLKPLSPTSFGSSADAVSVPAQPTSRAHASSVSTSESIGYGASARIPLPSSISTAASTGYQSSATSAAQSSNHKRTTSGATTATTSSQSQSSPISTSPPFSLAGSRPYQDSQRPSGISHTREATVKPSIPLPPAVVKGYSAAENTPKPRANVKPLPEMAPATGSAATVGRLEGKSAAATAREVREAGMRRGSAGDSARIAASTGSQSRRGGDLKIPARISMRQGSLKRELEAVKDFAASVDELKRLQANRQSVITALAPNPKRSSSRASNHPVNPATLQSIETQYGIWWECAELLVDLGGAAPPTVAGTPIQENQPSHNGSVGRSHGGPPMSSSSSTGHYGTQRSFSSSSSANDLSSRQLELLKQMLSTPNPTTFNFTDPAHVKWPKGRTGAEFSGSGSDHVVSDPPSSSTHGTKSSVNSASSLGDHRHPPSISRAQAPSTNYPYSQGTWTSKSRSGAVAGGSRPNLSGLFSTGDQNQTPTGKPTTRGSSTSRGTLADGSGSSATGGLVSTDDAEEEVSDWDLESSDSGKARRSALAAKAPSSSTASSSIDISQIAHVQTRLALTPETILPLLAYAREVKARLVDCLEELERARAKGRGSATVANPTAQYSSRTSRAPEVGTSTLRRA